MISRRSTHDRKQEWEVYRNLPASATSMVNEKFERGVALFNSGEFFLAHEVWEELWLVATEPEKSLLQGMIQTAAAFHHYLRGNFGGAESLLTSAAVKLMRSPTEDRKIDVASLLSKVTWWARMLGEGKDPGREMLPHISRYQPRDSD